MKPNTITHTQSKTEIVKQWICTCITECTCTLTANELAFIKRLQKPKGIMEPKPKSKKKDAGTNTNL